MVATQQRSVASTADPPGVMAPQAATDNSDTAFAVCTHWGFCHLIHNVQGPLHWFTEKNPQILIQGTN